MSLCAIEAPATTVEARIARDVLSHAADGYPFNLAMGTAVVALCYVVEAPFPVFRVRVASGLQEGRVAHDVSRDDLVPVTQSPSKDPFDALGYCF